MWAFDEVLDKPLRVEPPPRCGTPLVYDPRNQVVVMFGGHSGIVRHDLRKPGQGDGGPGRLNDTWLYDCRAKQWRDVSKSHRPPPTLWPKLAYDPASGLVLLITWDAKPGDDRAARTATLWGFDAATTEWQQLAQAGEASSEDHHRGVHEIEQTGQGDPEMSGDFLHQPQGKWIARERGIFD